MKPSVRLMSMDEAGRMVDYFLNASPDFLHRMGVDPLKLPNKNSWLELVQQENHKPLMDRDFYYLTWIWDKAPFGHSNINKITYGHEAAMHLHIWNPENRGKGLGTTCMWQSISIYFDQFQLKTLYCEPNSHNPGPNRTLKKLGFECIEQVEMIPGWINFLQPINRYRLTRDTFDKISKEKAI